jgi:hypothetical protein
MKENKDAGKLYAEPGLLTDPHRADLPKPAAKAAKQK